MDHKWWKSIFLLPIIGCTLYAGGYVAQFIRNYQLWEREFDTAFHFGGHFVSADADRPMSVPGQPASRSSFP